MSPLCFSFAQQKRLSSAGIRRDVSKLELNSDRFWGSQTSLRRFRPEFPETQSLVFPLVWLIAVRCSNELISSSVIFRYSDS